MVRTELLLELMRFWALTALLARNEKGEVTSCSRGRMTMFGVPSTVVSTYSGVASVEGKRRVRSGCGSVPYTVPMPSTQLK